ncbi:MAG TPA: guanylate kinase [Cyclobacteriaceae bacterium]
MNQNRSGFKGKAIIISAPSGSGKTSLARNLLKSRNDLDFSVSVCTRPPRLNEAEGVDYYFISNEEFKEKIAKGEFIEWEEVYNGMFYGTLKSEIQRIWTNKKHVLFDVDVKGALKLKKHFGADALAIFIKAPSIEEIERRLTKRMTENSTSMKIRFDKIKLELTFEKEFDVTVLNKEIEEANRNILSIVEKYLAS